MGAGSPQAIPTWVTQGELFAQLRRIERNPKIQNPKILADLSCPNSLCVHLQNRGLLCAISVVGLELLQTLGVVVVEDKVRKPGVGHHAEADQ